MKRLIKIGFHFLICFSFFFILKDFYNRYNPLPIEESEYFKIKVEKLLMEFKKDVAKHNIVVDFHSIKFQMIESNNTVSGICHKDKNIIQLVENFSKVTFYHEMGHCIFGANHLMVYDNNGNSESIMAWNNPKQSKYIIKNWDKYKSKFFTKDIHEHQSNLEMFYGFFIKNLLINNINSID